MENSTSMTRRAFAAALGMTGVWTALRVYGADDPAKKVLVKVGFVSDPHYANVAYNWAGDNRFFSASLAKIKATVAKFNELGLDIAIEGGDLADWSRVDAKADGEKSTELSIAAFEEWDAEFLKFNGPCYHVCGNHDFCFFTPEEFYAHVKNGGATMTEGYYSFVRNGVTFIVLDANYGTGDHHYSKDWSWNWTDANVSSAQMTWLTSTLAAAPGPCVVICHEILHPNGAGGHIVANAPAVRAVLEASGKVKTVLMGHQHTGMCQSLNGILYYAIPAQVTQSASTNSFAEVDVRDDGSAIITGYFLAKSVNPDKPGLAATINTTLPTHETMRLTA